MRRPGAGRPFSPDKIIDLLLDNLGNSSRARSGAGDLGDLLAVEQPTLLIVDGLLGQVAGIELLRYGFAIP